MEFITIAKILSNSLSLLEKKGKVKLKSLSLIEENSVEVYVYKNKRKLLFNELESDLRLLFTSNPPSHEPFNSLICIPIESADKVIGVIQLKSYKQDVYTFQDISVLKILSEYVAVTIQNVNLFNEVNYLATHDSLTGIYNRAKAIKQGEELFENLNKNVKNLSVLLLDIDRFKNINDTYGHIIGDFVLQSVSSIIKNCLNNRVFGRYGGEEFIIFVEGDSNEAMKIAENIRKGIQESKIIKIDENSFVKATISIGVYQYNKQDSDIYSGINKADKALYMAKNNGRNKVEYFIE